MVLKTDITGTKYFMLTAIRPTNIRSTSGSILWAFKCECGNEKLAVPSQVRAGYVKSCGCLGRPHGMTGTRLHRIWCGMRHRCYYQKQTGFKYWGGKGIKICDEWKASFNSFKEWAVNNGYSEGLTIDRIDNGKDYCPLNCRWVTYRQQSRNSSKVREITANGLTKILTDWASITGLSRTKIALRIDRYGYTPEQALELAPPPKTRTRKQWADNK